MALTTASERGYQQARLDALRSDARALLTFRDRAREACRHRPWLVGDWIRGYETYLTEGRSA